jgi:predicted permease
MREWLQSIRLRIHAIFHRRQFEQDLQDELEYHMELRRKNNSEIDTQQQKPFGNRTLIQETVREQWTFALAEQIWREVRQAARMLARTPAHSISIVLLLAIGIGANASMFSLFNALFVRDLPVADPQNLAVIMPYWSNPNYEDFLSRQKSFSGIYAGGSLLGTVLASESGEQIAGFKGQIVTGNYFQVLGARSLQGRTLTAEDDTRRDPQPVMVISYRMWDQHFDRSPDTIGRKMLLAGSPFTIVGVMPPGFFGDLPGLVRDFWVPMNMQPVANPRGDMRGNRGYNWLSVMGRLNPGVSIEQAQAEARVIEDRLLDEFNNSQPAGAPRIQRRESQRIRIEDGSSGFGGLRRSYGIQLQVLAGIVGIILLIVCANVATLLVARGTSRQRELAVRQALGCGRWRLIRQLFLEGLLLALAAALLGVGAAPLFAQALLFMQPSFDVVRPDLSLDWRILTFGAALSLLTSLVFSIAPALRASRLSIEPALRSGSRGSGGSVPGKRMIQTMVILQTAFSVVLVAASFLFARSVTLLRALDAGFERDHVVTSAVDANFAGYRGDGEQTQLGQRLIERLSALPGVKTASVSLCAPLMGCSRMGMVDFDGGSQESVWINPVSPGYFETYATRIQEGRGFAPQDRAGSPPIAIITEAVAQKHFPGVSPLGKKLTLRSSSGTPIEIVGVVKGQRFNPRDTPRPMIFLSTDQFPSNFGYVQIRTAVPPGSAMVSNIRNAMLEVDKKLYIRGPDPLVDILDQAMGREILLSRAGMLFGAIALLMACFGTYGVVSYLVLARRTELGIRLAIGALPAAVLREVVTGAIATVLPGIALGLGAAWAGGKFVESLLFGITGQDLATHAAVTVALLAATALAAYLPARRASRIDPLTALRCE